MNIGSFRGAEYFFPNLPSLVKERGTKGVRWVADIEGGKAR